MSPGNGPPIMHCAASRERFVVVLDCTAVQVALPLAVTQHPVTPSIPMMLCLSVTLLSHTNKNLPSILSHDTKYPAERITCVSPGPTVDNH